MAALIKKNIPLAREDANFLNPGRAVSRSHNGQKPSLCTVIQEENRGPLLENLCREKKHFKIRIGILKWSGYGLFILISTLLCLNNEKASAFTPGLSLSYGKGKPDSLAGYRIAFQSFWPFIWLRHSPVNLTGYWDLSFANWQTTPPQAIQPHSIHIIAISPLIRLQTRKHCFLSTQPYLELGIGASLLSNNHLGHRNLGGQFAFQDLMGIGLRWGATHIWSLSYHYLHYSNASLLPPNQGIDVKHLVSVGYEFN